MNRGYLPWLLAAGRPLGQLVLLHQGRGRRSRAQRDDVCEGALGRAAAARVSRRDPRRRRRRVAAPRGGPPDVLLRAVQRRIAVLAHRLGREAHRLDGGGHRAGDGADLRLRRRAAVSAARARIADPVGRRCARARGRGRADGRRPARRLVGSGGDAGGRPVVALVRRCRHVCAAPPSRHARPGARDWRHAHRRPAASAVRALPAA